MQVGVADGRLDGDVQPDVEQQHDRTDGGGAARVDRLDQHALRPRFRIERDARALHGRAQVPHVTSDGRDPSEVEERRDVLPGGLPVGEPVGSGQTVGGELDELGAVGDHPQRPRTRCRGVQRRVDEEPQQLVRGGGVGEQVEQSPEPRRIGA